MANPWLEGELKRNLRPVSAPDELWSRIHEQHRPLRVRPHHWRAWSIAMASLFVLLAGLVWRLGANSQASAGSAGMRVVQLRRPARSAQGGCVLCHA